MKYGKVMKLVDLLTRRRKMSNDLAELSAGIEVAKSHAADQMKAGYMEKVVIGSWELRTTSTARPDGGVELEIKEVE